MYGILKLYDVNSYNIDGYGDDNNDKNKKYYLVNIQTSEKIRPRHIMISNEIEVSLNISPLSNIFINLVHFNEDLENLT